MTPTEARRQLEDRAESYSRDARTFREMDDRVMATCYRTIAKELRAVAALIAR